MKGGLCVYARAAAARAPRGRPGTRARPRGVRGPAPLSLALAHITDEKGVVTFSPWTETDFRTGLKPWWK